MSKGQYQESIHEPETFWATAATRLHWMKPWDTVISGSLKEGNIKWFTGGELNASVNCLDRHLAKEGDKPAIIWEGDTPDQQRSYTFFELHREVCRFANILLSHGVQKGDRVCIYLPMIPEAAMAMLACARIGAVHSVVFGGFSSDALKQRIQDAGCEYVITATGGHRGGKALNIKANVDAAIAGLNYVKQVFVVRHTEVETAWHDKDVDVNALLPRVSGECEPAVMGAEDPLFILYTSGSTGKPKGVLHTTAGYLLYASYTHAQVFDIQPGDVYWCTADVGWITGHSYIVYGPLANGTTTLMYEGVPEYPDCTRWWEMIDRHQVSVFYTAPTAIRALMKHGDKPLEKSSRKTLRVLGSVGEPINPEAWRWFHEVVGNKQCPIMDTWWQTETGGIMIVPPTDCEQKPGMAMQPFFGIVPALLDDQGAEVSGEGQGELVIKQPWPGMMRTVYGDHQRFLDTYLKPHPGYYTTSDGAERDADGDYRISGRVDDTLNVSGHRFGTAEIESALVLHDAVAEAAVVGRPDELTGEAICAFVTLNHGEQGDAALSKALVQHVRKVIGPIAKIADLQFASQLPKTRSGKIMRRILRAIACHEHDTLGDTSTLANPEAVEALLTSSRTS